MGADDRTGLRTSTARGLSSRTCGVHAATVNGRTCIYADIMDPAGCGLGIQGILGPVSVIRQLKLVYHVTMGTNSWGITLPILSRPRTQGGLALPEPELFLMHQAAAPFVSLLGEPHKYPDKAVETFYAWATTIGFTPSKDNLPYIQLGMV